MNRLGAILVPMLGGFVLTFAVVSWRSGGSWRHEASQPPAAAQTNVEVRPPSVRVVQVNVSAARAARGFAAPPVQAIPAAAAAPAPAPEALPEPPPTADIPPPPRANSGTAEAAARKFARGSRAGE